MNNISAIYKIQSKLKPERFYIGSAVNTKERWKSHKTGLRGNKHSNSRLQNHYNKYGESDLEFTILLGCDKEDLIKHEQFFIDTLNPWFNICKTAGSTHGIGPSKKCIAILKAKLTGIPLKEEHKKRISESHLGIYHTEETKLKLRKQRLGKKLSEEHKRKISLGGIGRIPSEETRKKLSQSNLGHKVSEETKRKISFKNKGLKISEETKRKLSLRMKGRKLSEETKKKISESKMGQKSWNKGLNFSEDTKRKMSEAAKLRWSKRVA